MVYIECNSISNCFLQWVYRVFTAGGKAPATCKGLGQRPTVHYAAEYCEYINHSLLLRCSSTNNRKRVLQLKFTYIDKNSVLLVAAQGARYQTM